MEEAEFELGRLIERHLMLELAALLSEGASAVVDPFVAEGLGALAPAVGIRRAGTCDKVVDVALGETS